MAVFAFCSIAKILHTFQEGLKIPIKSDKSLHMCSYVVQEWCTASRDVEVWAGQIMGTVCLFDLFRALYIVCDVARWWDRVEDVRAHFLQSIWYPLDR